MLDWGLRRPGGAVYAVQLSRQLSDGRRFDEIGKADRRAEHILNSRKHSNRLE
jgi:hypothetical protein